MSEKTLPLKTYKVLKRLGWQGGTFMPEDTVEMTEGEASFFLDNQILKPATKAEAQQAHKEG